MLPGISFQGHLTRGGSKDICNQGPRILISSHHLAVSSCFQCTVIPTSCPQFPLQGAVIQMNSLLVNHDIPSGKGQEMHSPARHGTSTGSSSIMEPWEPHILLPGTLARCQKLQAGNVRAHDPTKMFESATDLCMSFSQCVCSTRSTKWSCCLVTAMSGPRAHFAKSSRCVSSGAQMSCKIPKQD